jgi:hypothetical protein
LIQNQRAAVTEIQAGNFNSDGIAHLWVLVFFLTAVSDRLGIYTFLERSMMSSLCHFLFVDSQIVAWT